MSYFTLNWWFSVVLVGIVINIVSKRLEHPLDRLLSHFSIRWKERSEKKRQRQEDSVRRHLIDPNLVPPTGFEQQSMELRAIAAAIMSILATIAAELHSARNAHFVADVIFGVFFFFVAFAHFLGANRRMKVLRLTERARVANLDRTE